MATWWVILWFCVCHDWIWKDCYMVFAVHKHGWSNDIISTPCKIVISAHRWRTRKMGWTSWWCSGPSSGSGPTFEHLLYLCPLIVSFDIENDNLSHHKLVPVIFLLRTTSTPKSRFDRCVEKNDHNIRQRCAFFLESPCPWEFLDYHTKQFSGKCEKGTWWGTPLQDVNVAETRMWKD